VAATNRARHPCGSSDQPDYGLRPDGLCRPRRTLVPLRVQWVNHRPVAAGLPVPIPGWLTLRAIRFCCSGDGKLASNSDQLALIPVPNSGSPVPSNSCEAARHIERLTVLQDVITRPRQLVRQCLDGNHVVGFRFLSLIKTLGFRTVTPGKVGRFNECPSQILVAVLAVAGIHAIHAVCVGGKVAYLGKPLDRTRLQQNGGSAMRDMRRDMRDRPRFCKKTEGTVVKTGDNARS